MKKLSILLLICCSSYLINAQGTPVRPAQQVLDTIQIVDAACGQCKFNLKGTSCDLAVRIKGKAFFVDGTKIDDHGDAHADDGFCNKIRKAKVRGTVVNNRFVATSFELLPEKKAKQTD